MTFRRSWIASAGLVGLMALFAVGCTEAEHHPTPDANPVIDGAPDRGDAAADLGRAGDVAREGGDGAVADAAAPAEVGGADARSEGAPDVAGDTGTDVGGMEAGASCVDNARNGDESDTDCGGSCGRCGVGKACRANADCASGACNASHICVECLSPANCPGADAECSQRACVGGACLVALTAAGRPVATQIAGDCRSRQCDGLGQIVPVTDDTDLPIDNNPCTRDVCAGGNPSNPPTAAASTCGTGQLCDGLGHCVGCLTPADCPGTDNECRQRTCVQNLCGFNYRATGLPTASQTIGDCKLSVCDGIGNAQPSPLDTDVPVDGNVCTRDLCTTGTPSNPPVDIGTSCGGANICDGHSRCVQCVSAATCPGQDTDCQMRTCNAQGQCGLVNASAGVRAPTQTAGDCKVNQCDGSGHVVPANDNLDTPVDNNVCTDDVCTAGVPSNPRHAVGASCGGSNHCDAAAHCVACTVATDCPAPETACQLRTCVQGVCGVDFVANATPVVAQIPGDCKVIECDGHGVPVPVVDDTDKPIDGNACTDDVCMLGLPSNPDLEAATSCGGHNECDGHGHCIGCMVAEDCPGTDRACQARTCSTDFVCGLSNVDDGTPAGTQVTGDCRTSVCDGAGNLRAAVDDADLPEDNNPCTSNVCSAGTPSHPPLPSGAGCGGTHVCDGQGHCVACVLDADCGPTTLCQSHGCGADHVCLDHFVPAGTNVGTQLAGDCQVVRCDGLGNIATLVDDGDVPVDGIPCTQDLCDLGVPSNPFSTSRTACTGGVCDGQGSCVGCVVAADCAADTACQTHACGNDHTCSTTNVASGTPVGTQLAGDCRAVQCDGHGVQVTATDPTDVIDDGNGCTDDVCQGQTPAHPFKAAGTSCGGTSVCDGQGNCGPAPELDAGTDAGADADAGPAGCPAPYLFCDDFEDGDALGWTKLEQTSSTPGTWTILSENGPAGTTTFDFQGTGVMTSYHYEYPSVAAAGGPWGDQTVSVWIKPTVTPLSSDNNKVGVCARFSTSGTGSATITNAYCLFLRADPSATNGRLQLSKKAGTGSLGGLLSTTTSNFPPATIPLFALDTWYKVTLQVSGSDSVVLTGSINDVKLVTFVDAPAAVDGAAPVLVSTGGPALILRGTTASYDDLRVSSP